MAVNICTTSPIYLDYNATCPVAPEVCESIAVALADYYGNPSSLYDIGVAAKEAIQSARIQVALMIGARNVSACTFVDPRPFSGHIEVSDIMLAVQQDTCLISVMLANNETGVLQPVKMLAEKIQNTNRFRENKIYIHTDAAQAIGKIVVDVKQLKVDYLTIVGHKFYGPRIGALYVRSLGSLAGAPLLPIFHGGNQENGFRAGTENTAMIIGLGEAAKLVNERLHADKTSLKFLRDHLEYLLNTCIEGTVIHFAASPRLPNTSSVAFSSSILTSKELLNRVSFYASTSAACHSKDDEGSCSTVLQLCGISPELASKTVRLSIGRNTSKDDIEKVVDELKRVLGSQ